MAIRSLTTSGSWVGLDFPQGEHHTLGLKFPNPSLLHRHSAQVYGARGRFIYGYPALTNPPKTSGLPVTSLEVNDSLDNVVSILSAGPVLRCVIRTHGSSTCCCWFHLPSTHCSRSQQAPGSPVAGRRRCKRVPSPHSDQSQAAPTAPHLHLVKHETITLNTMSALSAAGRDTAPALSLRVTHVGANIIPLAVLFTPCEISNWKQQSDTTGGPDKAQSGGWRNVRNNTGGNKQNAYFYIIIILGNNTKQSRLLMILQKLRHLFSFRKL